MLRALTESAQGRLTIIAGSRDGLSERVFDPQAAAVAAEELRGILGGTSAARSFHDARDVDRATFDEDVADELSALARAGLEQVAVVNLTQARYDIAVVRVVIPGLEAMSEVPGYVFGERARRVLARAAA